MIIDGEKYACEACVRGHRVSNCQHYDRQLQHINKKGRPVSQCQHCRAMRKSRSSHVKCDCGEKPSKCAHLQPTVEGHTETCCCNHGGACSCAQKKDSALDPVRESDSEHESLPKAIPKSKTTARRRRANTVHSDGVFSFEQNGHQRQKIKHSRAQKSGAFPLNRVNSAHSSSSLGASVDGKANEDATDKTRRVKSEATSPMMSGGFNQMNSLPPLDLSNIEYPSYPGGSSFDLFGSAMPTDYDAPIFSAGLAATPVDWSNYNLEKKSDAFASSFVGAQSYGGPFDFGSGSDHLPNLTNTTTTSGDVSEVEDFMPGGEGDYDSFASGFGHQGSMLSHDADLSSIDYNSFYKPGDSGHMGGSGVSMVEDDPAFWMPNYNDRVPESGDSMPQSSMNGLWDM